MEKTREDAIVVKFANAYEKIWRFYLGKYPSVSPQKQKYEAFKNLRNEIDMAFKLNTFSSKTAWALTYLYEACDKDFPLFDLNTKDGMKPFIQGNTYYPDWVLHEDDVHEVHGLAMMFMGDSPAYYDDSVNTREFAIDKNIGVCVCKHLLVFYEIQKTSPYLTVFSNAFSVCGSVFWMYGYENNMMKSIPYTKETMNFMVKRVAA